jgi:glyoxylase-like metal-dependent hydrolase (beta-lactamase superfamily II)/rhodanese-related sulfurtransferase
MVHVEALVDEGLGNSSYLLDLGDGRALAVDASIDLREVRAATQRRRLSVAFAADTHLHADFVTGARQLSVSGGARLLASAAGGREYDHTGLRDGDEVDLGGLTLTALVTPGHTSEHVAYLISDGGRPHGVFTGGSLLVGSAARTDLVSPELTEQLARAQYRSIQRLMTLPDDVAVWPTHGAGSFCSARSGAPRTSTIGAERRGNPFLSVADEDAFVERLLASLGTYPPYFGRLPELNRRGPRLLGRAPSLPVLTPDQVAQLVAESAVVVDVRPMAEYAAGHVLGAVSIPLRPAFATWLGWVLEPHQPVVVVRSPGQDAEEIAWQAAKIGYDRLVGELTGSPDDWAVAGLQVATTPVLTAGQVDGRRVLDVRQHAEFAAGHVPGAIGVELGDLPHRASSFAGASVVVMCAHGERALTGASLLERAGVSASVLAGGPEDWAAAHGATLAVSA